MRYQAIAFAGLIHRDMFVNSKICNGGFELAKNSCKDMWINYWSRLVPGPPFLLGKASLDNIFPEPNGCRETLKVISVCCVSIHYKHDCMLFGLPGR
jgi:hypothetical protein